MRNELALNRPAEILLVEDNDNDVELARQGFKRTNLPLNLNNVRDGEECLAFLSKKGKYVAAPTPDLILLDLNMPRMGGREVFAEMLRDERLKSFPVVVFTTSEREKEVLEMYQMRCSSSIVKPVDFEQFLKVTRAIAEYWFTIVVLPRTPDELRLERRT